MADSSGPSQRTPKLTVEALEDRTVPTFLSRAGLPSPALINGQPFPTTGGGLSVAVGNLVADNLPGGLVENEYVTGTGPGRESLVRVFSRSGTLLTSFVPFAGFTGGINVAVGDVLGDRSPEIIVSVAGSGPPIVKVYNAQGQLQSSFLAFNAGFLGGVNIAVGNVLGGIGGGGFSGGAISGQFKQEIIAGAAAGGSPHVVVTNGAGAVLRSFLAFDLGYRGGVTVAAASIDTTRSAAYNFTGIDTNAYDEIIVGAATRVPHVKAFSVDTGAIRQRLSFFAFDPAVGQGVTVAAGSTDGNRGAEIYAALIAPTGGVTVRAFNSQAQQLAQFSPFPSTYTGVVNMTVGYLTSPLFSAAYNPADDDSVPGNNSTFFNTQDLTIVTGDGPFEQVPRFLDGQFNSAAGLNGP